MTLGPPRRRRLRDQASPGSNTVSGELHITSLVVHSTPGRAQGVSNTIAGIPGARVHALQNGKLVVTLEAGTADEMLAMITGIQRADGVLSAALVSQYVDSLDAMNQEIPDADR
jgi:periplasmic nitrate reductase NapD